MEYVVPAEENGQPLEAVAAKFQLGLTNMLEANPKADPLLLQAGERLVIPHQLILPDAPREGIVLNVAEMRLYYYPKGKKVVEVLPMTQAATRFIAHADSDSQLVKQALEQRSGMPIAINR